MTLAKAINVTEKTARGLAYETQDATVASVKKLARYFGWSPEEVGAAVLHVPRCLRKVKRRGKKMRVETEAQDAA